MHQHPMWLRLLAAMLALASAAPAAPPTRNITGVATPAVGPADGTNATLLEYVVRGSGFGDPSSQPADLVCRIKVGYTNQ